MLVEVEVHLAGIRVREPTELEVEELEEVGVADVVPQFGGVDRRGFARGGEHTFGVCGRRQALEELGADLAVELADGPAGAYGFGFVEGACFPIFNGHQADVMGPRKGEGNWRN